MKLLFSLLWKVSLTYTKNWFQKNIAPKMKKASKIDLQGLTSTTAHLNLFILLGITFLYYTYTVKINCF